MTSASLIILFHRHSPRSRSTDKVGVDQGGVYRLSQKGRANEGKDAAVVGESGMCRVGVATPAATAPAFFHLDVVAAFLQRLQSSPVPGADRVSVGARTNAVQRPS